LFRSKGRIKHVMQSEALVKLMENNSMFQNSKIFVEFGAGSALLSATIFSHLQKKFPFFLIDRINGIHDKV
jgi:hypothetical protein